MCFCLRRANRLIPNRFSFPLMDRTRGSIAIQDEEGLLVNYNDDDDNDAEVIVDHPPHTFNSA
ncbi:hypothetical protein BDB01DRAFT_771097 [Pilobolus umbonatus]|nr:hypothetical protein BDB01DRAFT_771097 [Pilobolus umbonatus]